MRITDLRCVAFGILSLALSSYGAVTVIDFESPLPNGSIPSDGFSQGTFVGAQSLVTTQYSNLGVLIEGAALVTFYPGHAPSGSNGISPVRQRQQIDYDAPITFTFVSLSDNAAKGTTDFFSIHPDLANCSGNSVTVSAYALNGQLVGMVVYQETCAPSAPITISGFGQFHRVVVDSTLLSQVEGGIGFDLVTFGPVFASQDIATNMLANGDFEAGNVGFGSDYAFGRTDAAQGNYDIVLNPRDSHGGGAAFADHTSGRGFMLVANGAADTNRAVWRQSLVQCPLSPLKYDRPF